MHVDRQEALCAGMRVAPVRKPNRRVVVDFSFLSSLFFVFQYYYCYYYYFKRCHLNVRVLKSAPLRTGEFYIESNIEMKGLCKQKLMGGGDTGPLE